MATPGLPPTFSIASIDAQRVEEALARIGPKWTTWTAMTLAQVNGPVRVRDVAAQLPFVSEQFVGKRLATMHADGLVIRDDDRRGAPDRLSALGTSLAPVLRTVSDWSRTHLTQELLAEAERIEDALRRLHLRHSTAVIHALDSADGPMWPDVVRSHRRGGAPGQRPCTTATPPASSRWPGRADGLPARRPLCAHRCRPGVGGRLRECRALEPALRAAKWNSGTASGGGSNAHPRRHSAGGGSRQRPDRGGPTA
ncbi:winged helix-turn-helix transcriptional regulator [Streptomyces sp. NPDC013130]|uniref:winged helix-turn-helix transcriptional regulator n=1 Tax=Streptomyces sp. NPDC013130 TaxID=3156695 RepID=UPI0033D1760C